MAQWREAWYAVLVIGGAVFLSVAGSVGAQWAAAPSSYYPPPSPPTTVVHVNVPASPAALELFRLIQERGDLSMFYDALTQSRINLTLNGIVSSQKVTVLAPTNGAFGALSDELKACLNTASGKIDVLTQVMLYHLAVGGNYSAAELSNMTRLTAASGMPLDLAVTPDGTLIVEGTAKVVFPDAIFSPNATVHVIDDIMFPESIISTVLIECYGVPASSSLPLPLPSTGSF